MGRPTKYQAAFAKQAEKLCKLGATDEELAEFFEIDVATLDRWKVKYSGFRGALKLGKDKADAEVAEKLFRRATGYSCPDVDIRVIRGKIVKTPLVKHYPPDTVAAIFWLKNRQRKKWRDKVETGITDGDGNDIPVVIFKIPENGRSSQTPAADH